MPSFPSHITLPAPLLLDTEAALPRELVFQAVAGRAASVMLASNPVFGKVTIANAFVIVAVTAVPLELMVTIVCPVPSVLMPTNVASEPEPTVVEREGVRVSVAEPRVMTPPMVAVPGG